MTGKLSPSQKIIVFLGSGLGIGFIRKAPGTMATLATVPLYWWLSGSIQPLHLTITLALIIIGIPISQKIETIYNVKDNRCIVIDEVAGFLVTMLWLPRNLQAIILGFVFFRLFDILKPPPVGIIDRKVAGGWGVMLDDVVAGIMANVASRLVLHLITGAPL
jgi:phosphatidylglycerophosphatase A